MKSDSTASVYNILRDFLCNKTAKDRETIH